MCLGSFKNSVYCTGAATEAIEILPMKNSFS